MNITIFQVECIKYDATLAFVQENLHLSQLPLRQDPKGEYYLLEQLEEIIENSDTPPEVEVTANAMYESELLRNW
jgi:hypothetical protein